MLNFFARFASCYGRSRRRRPPADDGFISRIDSSRECRRVRSNRSICRKNRPLDWRPGLPVIMEDYVDDYHDVDVQRKSDDSSRKDASVVSVACISRFYEMEFSKPNMFVSAFYATPYMF